MSLEKMLQMQKELDERIIKEKGLDGQDLTFNTVNALIVELSEFANEGRWFKHWSNRQTPTVKQENEKLLEEFVDAVHFFLSLANTNGWQELLWIHVEGIEDMRREGFENGLSGAFLEMNYWILIAFIEKDRDEKLERELGLTKQQFAFRNAWSLFLAIGLVGFNFTFEQIYQAYCKKNKVNHQRQEEGY